MDSKQIVSVEIKDETKGEVEAVFATLNVKDRDDDVTLPGAFENGAEVVISAYGHKSWEGAPPVGKGIIAEVGDKVVMRGQFFMKTQAGRDTFEVVKELGPKQQWSYGFNVDESEPGEHEGKSVRVLKKMTVHEVSPVMRGAGIGTGTTYAKADLSTAGRRREAASGAAMPDGSYPIENTSDLHNAIQAIGRAKNPDATKRHIIRRARALGATDMLPNDWAKSLNEEISFAVVAAQDAVDGAKRVVALRAQKGDSLSKINAETLAGLKAVLAELDSFAGAEQDTTDYGDQMDQIFLASVAESLESESE